MNEVNRVTFNPEDTSGLEIEDNKLGREISFGLFLGAFKRIRPKSLREKVIDAESVDVETARKALSREWKRLPESIRVPEESRNDIPVAWLLNPMPSHVDLYSLNEDDAQRLSNYLEFRDIVASKIVNV